MKNTKLPKRPIIDKIGNPLDWTYVNKVLLLLIVQVVVFGTFTVYNFYVVHYPNTLPDYVHIIAATKTIPRQLTLNFFYIILTIIALWFRWQKKDNKFLAYILALIIAAHGAIFLGAIGYATNPVTFLCIFLQAFLGLLLFDIYFSYITLSTWTIVIGIHIVGEQLGAFKYAPVIDGSPVSHGKIDTAWLIWNMGTGLFLTGLMFTLCVYVLNRWREREHQVTEYSELLKTMFGRYLSTEVMSSLIEDPSLLDLGGERREVTIMMTDLRGFTALSERLKPEQVVQMLNSYFEVMVETVLKYKGTINEIIGDALLVIFGAPQDMSDQAERAIACSIEMQNAMQGVNKENRLNGLPDLEMGIGINKAEVIVGNIGSSKRSKYTVVGSGVNMTSRIESYTVGGQILISESVQRETRDKLRIDDQQEVYPKGSESPLKIYEVGGIADQYNLTLEVRDTTLVTLQKHIPFHYALVGNKHIPKENLEGQIVKLSQKSAEVVFDGSSYLLTNLKMNLIGAGKILLSKDVYAKIVDKNEKKNYIIRFTSIPPEVNSYFHAYRQHASNELRV